MIAAFVAFVFAVFVFVFDVGFVGTSPLTAFIVSWITFLVILTLIALLRSGRNS